MALAISFPPIDPKRVIIGILILLLFVVAFILGRNSKPDFAPPIQTDISKWVKKNDSLFTENKNLKEINKGLFISLDSLKAKKITNKIKTKSDVAKIKNFTYTSRHRFNDSTMVANGLK